MVKCFNHMATQSPSHTVYLLSFWHNNNTNNNSNNNKKDVLSFFAWPCYTSVVWKAHTIMLYVICYFV